MLRLDRRAKPLGKKRNRYDKSREIPKLHFSAINAYNLGMNRFRQITTVFVCLLFAVPSSVFAKSCCGCCASDAIHCCTVVETESCCCCCVKSEAAAESCCASKADEQCDCKCKCSTRDLSAAILDAESKHLERDSVVVFRFFEVFCSFPVYKTRTYSFVERPPGHNKRQAVLCVWLK